MKRYYVYLFLFIILVAGSWYYRSGRYGSNNNKPETYTPNITGLPKVYESSKYGFKINLPNDFIVDENYIYESTPQRAFSGVKFTIPVTKTEKTNLASDTYLSVEQIPNSVTCEAGAFLDSSEPKGLEEYNGHKYNSAYSIGAGAGNRYEETVYATTYNGGCIAVRYFIHYGVIENYPEGSVTEFNKEDLLKLFDSIRKTLVLK